MLVALLMLLPVHSVDARIFEDPTLRVVDSALPVADSTDIQENTVYVVKRGDTLSQIAQRYQVSVKQLMAQNNITNPNLISIGQMIEIPAIGSASNRVSVVHTVKRGDTLWDIAKLYGVNVNTLTQFNGLYNPNDLKIGQDVVIPADVAAVNASLADSSDSSKRRTVQLASRSESGSFLWPVQGVITSKFGRRWGEFHYGLDIAAPTGTPVKASRAGVVVASGWRGTYGNAVIIEHDSNYRTLYAHNSRLLVKEGDVVVAGQKIAEVGSTGRSTGPHLHFEIHQNEKALDPLRFLQ